MRKSMLALAMLGLIVAASASAEVQWADASFDEILAKAKQENRHVFIDFFTTWCGPCKTLDEVTYVDGKVVEFLNTHIAVKYDAEKGFGEELAEKYKVIAYPTLILISPDGEEIDRHLGYLPPEDFLKVMSDYMAGIGTVAYYDEKLKANPGDVVTLLTLGMKHADAVRPVEAEKCLKKVLELDPDEAHVKRVKVIYTLGEANYSAESYEAAKKHFQSVIDEYAGTDEAESAMRRLAYTEHKLGNSDVAVATYEKYMSNHMDSPGALNGFAWFCAQRKIGLDKALPVALKAAELSDRDPGILDTLAEVYFARGEYSDAIRIEKEALAKDPDDQYLKDQIEKFEKAQEEAESQAGR